MPNYHGIEVEKVAKTPFEVEEVVNDARFEEIHDTKAANNEVDIHKDNAVARTTDDIQTGRRAEQGQEELFEAAHDVKEDNEGLTRPRRMPKPNSIYSPEVYDLNYVQAVRRSKNKVFTMMQDHA